MDGAQLVPGAFVDVQALGVDYLAFSFHKILAPFGVGVLYAREHLLRATLPFLYGGDMIAEGRVLPDRVEYNALPWKYAAGTPNILGTIVSAQAMRVLLDLALTPDRPTYFGIRKSIERAAVHAAMERVSRWHHQLTSRGPGRARLHRRDHHLRPRDPARRTSLVAFNLADRDPMSVAEALNQAGVESRAGCHCAMWLRSRPSRLAGAYLRHLGTDHGRASPWGRQPASRSGGRRHARIRWGRCDAASASGPAPTRSINQR